LGSQKEKNREGGTGKAQAVEMLNDADVISSPTSYRDRDFPKHEKKVPWAGHQGRRLDVFGSAF
jgi:hypothetical protein